MSDLQPMNPVEWVRLTSYWCTTASGESLTPEQAADCDALAARIKIPRTVHKVSSEHLKPFGPLKEGGE